MTLITVMVLAQAGKANIRCVILDTSQNPQPVVNVIMYDTNIDGQVPPGMQAPFKAKCGDVGAASPGWSWDGTKFIEPAPTPVQPLTGQQK